MSDFENVSFGIAEASAGETARASLAARLVRRLVPRLDFGSLRVMLPNGDVVSIAGREPGPHATITLRRWRTLRRVATGGDIGFAEAYIAGEWTSADLVGLLRLAARNAASMRRADGGWWLWRAIERLRHNGRANSRSGSRRNIMAHYDLGNAFYARWLDGAMQYSSALYADAAETLESAQQRKLARIAGLLELAGGESVLEIGCGWGGLAERLASRHAASVTALTLSPAQRAWAEKLAADSGVGARIDVRLQDYRDVEGSFDRIVSIEMLEAVGQAWWPTYFRTLRERLKPGGRAVIQVITIEEPRFETYRRTPDFVQKYVFPGGFLPSVTALKSEIAGAGLTLARSETFGLSYARTLAEWRARFLAHWPDISSQGFDERFLRLWTYYLCYCEAAFLEGAIDVGLYVIEKPAV
jgi:cyclopropane-fatty-acyl-phospholipid synthase